MRTVAYCGDYVALTTTDYGRKIYVDTRDISISSHIMMQGQWEPWITELFQALFRPNTTFVDVGANMGWYTLLACHLGASKVAAFEPNPRLHRLLDMSVSVNGFRDQVELHRFGVSDAPGVAALSWNPVEHGGGHVTAVDESKKDGARRSGDDPDWLLYPAARSDRIELCRLDDAIQWPISFLKIDVEGHEPKVLKGAERHILEDLPVMLIEHHEGDLPSLEWLASQGYGMRQVQHDGHAGRLLTASEATELPNADMILATPPT